MSWFVVKLRCELFSPCLSASKPPVTALDPCKRIDGPDGKVMYECFKDSRTQQCIIKILLSHPSGIGNLFLLKVPIKKYISSDNPPYNVIQVV
jgi:hypothetical protein